MQSTGTTGSRRLMRRGLSVLSVVVLLLVITIQSVAAATFYGYQKGILKSPDGSYHHFVLVRVNTCTANGWTVRGPLWPGTWGGIRRCVGTVQVFYKWPGNLWDPYPASSWSVSTR